MDFGSVFENKVKWRNFEPKMTKITKECHFIIPTHLWSSAKSICFNILTCWLHHWLALELYLICSWIFCLFQARKHQKYVTKVTKMARKFTFYQLLLQSPSLPVSQSPQLSILVHPKPRLIKKRKKCQIWPPNSSGKITLIPFHLCNTLKS